MNDLDVDENNVRIRLHKAEDFAHMRKAGKLAAECLDLLVKAAQPGVTTAHLNQLCVMSARDHKAVPATVNYRGYKHAICTSINHIVCHGMPNDKPLLDGDIVNIDVTLIVDGWFGDTSRMASIGNVSRKAERLVEVTYECLMRGISQVKPGNTLGDVGYAIQSFAEAERCSVVRDFCGHGLGQVFHDHPNVLHYGRRGQGVVLKPGMFFTIEPMINLGKSHVKVLSDGWTAVTRDRSLSAQFEHTIGVTETGCEIFTLSPQELQQRAHKS
jgi:methionyl aminopeptidase